MKEYQSFSEKETQKIGEDIAAHLKPGTVITLTGDLGAGKSVFARGIAKGLGISGPIPSPTFTILQEYVQGRIPLYHFDWYRIEDEEELYEIGVEEYLYGQGICLIEWPQKAEKVLPKEYISIKIVKGEEPNVRKILVADVKEKQPI